MNMGTADLSILRRSLLPKEVNVFALGENYELAEYKLNLLVRKIFYMALLIITMAGAYFVLINTTLADLFADLGLLVIRVGESRARMPASKTHAMQAITTR